MQTGGIACNYFDRYIHIALRKGPISKRQMQMIASTCLLISAKFFDRKLPPLSELAIVHNHAVSVEQFMHQEMVILEALEWKLHVILPHALIEPLQVCLPDAPFDLAIDERITFFIDLSVYGACRTTRASAQRSARRTPRACLNNEGRAPSAGCDSAAPPFDGPAPLALAGYSLKRYTQAEILGGSILAAWKFSNESVACDYFLPAMADACATCEDSLQRCANELVEVYYLVCFPDAPKMIPQPIEPVQLVEFTDLFPGLPLLGACASVPPAVASVPLGRADSTATQLNTLGETEDVFQGLADARARHQRQPDGARRQPRLAVPNHRRDRRRAVVRPARERCLGSRLRGALRDADRYLHQGFSRGARSRKGCPPLSARSCCQAARRHRQATVRGAQAPT